MKVFTLLFIMYAYFVPCKWDDQLYLNCTREFLVKEKLVLGTDEIYLNFAQEPSEVFTRQDTLLIDSSVIKLNYSKKGGRFNINFGAPKPGPDSSTFNVSFTAKTPSGQKYFGDFLLKCNGGKLKYFRASYVKSIQ